jgi:GT2 family glycosyltransferase
MVFGWLARQAHNEPAATLAILNGGTVTSLVEAAEPAPAGAPDDAVGFHWRVPRLILDAAEPKPISVIDLRSGEMFDLPLILRPIEGASSPRAKEFGVEPMRWPHGLASALTPYLNEITDDLYVDVDPLASAARFYRQEGPVGRAAPQWGVRFVADNEAAWNVHQRIPTAAAAMAATEMLRLWIKLARAVSNYTHCQTEISLSRWDGQCFQRLRRLRRARTLRVFSSTDLLLELTIEEIALAQAGELFLSVALARCFGLVIGPPTPLAEISYDERFEDGRLTGAFAACEMLTRVGSPELGRKVLMLPDTPPAELGPADAYPLTDVIVPIYNGADVIMRCLSSVQSATDTPFRVWIVDDGSRGYTSLLVDQLVDKDPRFSLHRRLINRGYTKSINEAIKLTDADWVVILNSDTVVPHGWLRRLHDAAKHVPNAGMVGPLSNAATWQSIPQAKNADNTWSQNDFITADLVDQVQERLAAVSEQAYPDSPVLNGFCTLIARAVFERCGIYDEEAFPLGYGEETDMCLRAGLAGFKLVIADDCFVYHEKSVSFGSAKRSQLTRAGGFELKNKHPGINIAAIERRMQFNPTMMQLRAKLIALEAELKA